MFVLSPNILKGTSIPTPKPQWLILGPHSRCVPERLWGPRKPEDMPESLHMIDEETMHDPDRHEGITARELINAERKLIQGNDQLSKEQSKCNDAYGTNAQTRSEENAVQSGRRARRPQVFFGGCNLEQQLLYPLPRAPDIVLSTRPRPQTMILSQTFALQAATSEHCRRMSYRRGVVNRHSQVKQRSASLFPILTAKALD